MFDGTLLEVARSRARCACAFGFDADILGNDLGGVPYKNHMNICPKSPKGPMTIGNGLISSECGSSDVGTAGGGLGWEQTVEVEREEEGGRSAPNAYIFTSLHPCHTCYNYVGNTLPPPPKDEIYSVAHSAEKLSSTIANLPARHYPNTHPALSNYFQPMPNTSSRYYYARFIASDAASDSDRAITRST
eukprot:scaffold12907_cov68-Cyclotella_meneghiniana.AAC.1